MFKARTTTVTPRHTERLRAVPTRIAILAAVVLVCSVTAPATAEELNLLDQQGQLSLGIFVNKNRTDVRLDPEFGGIGTDFDWDKAFGDTETRFRLDGLWRFTDKHHVRVMYTDFSRKGTAVFDEDVQWGDQLIPVNASATGKLEFSIVEVAYEYALKHTENFEFSLSAGLHYTDFEAKLAATIDTPEGGVEDSISDKATLAAPLPVLGAHGIWNIGRSFYVDAYAQWFALSVDQYDGGLVNYRASVLWQPNRWFGIGAGYDVFRVDLKVDGGDFRGSLDWSYSGPQVFLNFAF